MVKITITGYVNEDMLQMETSSCIPTKEAIENTLNRQFSCIEDIEIKQEKQ